MAELSFLGNEPVEVPGEVVIGVVPQVSSALEVSLASGPSRGAFSAATLGVSALDQVLSRLNVVDIRRVHSPAPPPPPGVMSAEIDATTDATFRIRFEASLKVSTAVSRLAALDEVVFAEPVYLRESFVVPNDPSYPQQWGLAKIRCPEAWDRTTGSANVTVAVVDTGVDLDHPELAGLLVAGQDMVDLGPNPGPPRPGWVWEGDFNGRDNNPQDEVGHGTHVAGTIACASNDGTGVAGVTWGCRLMPVKVLNRARRLSDNRISGFGTSVDIAAGIRWAADNGARIINLSLGGPGNDQVTANAVAYALSRGCLVVAAMGNTGDAVPQFPAALPDVLSVGAVDANDVRAGFSSMGPHIDVAAPGVGILSTLWDNGYGTMDGTSMASPHVAGVAALMLSCNGALTPAQLRQMIRDSARALRDNPADPVPNDRYGTGLVDARAAIDLACPVVVRSLRILTCASNQIRCASNRIRCASTAVRCSSLVTLCPSVTIRCQSLEIRCESLAVVCPSLTVQCPSVSVVCPSEAIRCISVSISCPSQTIRCGTGLVCVDPGRPIEPGPFRASADEYGDDPYGVDYGDDDA
jgi:hypothetical protein